MPYNDFLLCFMVSAILSDISNRTDFSPLWIAWFAGLSPPFTRLSSQNITRAIEPPILRGLSTLFRH